MDAFDFCLANSDPLLKFALVVIGFLDLLKQLPEALQYRSLIDPDRRDHDNG
jgi:hypothetical protein